MTRQILCFAFALTGVVLTVGCSGPSPQPDSGDQPFATYSQSGASGDGAGIAGRLILEDGCVYLISPEFSERWVPVFRAEANPEWRDGTLVFDGEEYAADETVGLGGSGWEGSEDPLTIPESCDDSPRWTTWTVGPEDAL
ncbi:hypothetical protein [Arthrobacter sp. TB 23]|uniref:hypothetical protein n=1 Tax=Arthrobacter sp. TB 23 TaxID=494419 RepID=UPI0002F3CAA7|nr:hypothetical protein [Arthrobacter sp. TB 23]